MLSVKLWFPALNRKHLKIQYDIEITLKQVLLLLAYPEKKTR